MRCHRTWCWKRRKGCWFWRDWLGSEPAGFVLPLLSWNIPPIRWFIMTILELIYYRGTYVLWCYVLAIWCICCTFGEADAKIPDLKLRKEIAPEAGHQGSWLQWLSQTDWNSSCCACLHSLQPSFVVGHQFWTVQVGDRPKLFDRYLEQQVPLSTCCKHMLWCILGALVEL